MRFIAADRIFDGTSWLFNDAVLVYDNQSLLKDIIKSSETDPLNIQRFEGLLCPGFVNTHCHLELSHLNGIIPQNTGLPAFGPQVVKNRGLADIGIINECMQEADRSMFNEGIVAVGDISNTDISFKHKQQSKLLYHTFVELIGFNPVAAAGIFRKGIELFDRLTNTGLNGSLAAHAPYSCSQELIRLISSFDAKQKLSFCIHNQESEEETNFFLGKQSGFYELYRDLGIDVSWWKPPGHNSLQWFIGELNEHRSILIHNTFSSAQDIESAESKNVYWCFCPSANLYIEGKLPDLSLFKDQTQQVCIGTDSLASNSSLSVIKEINLVLQRAEFHIPDLLRAATRNGAEALGLSDQCGVLVPGNRAGLLQLGFQNNTLTFKARIL